LTRNHTHPCAFLPSSAPCCQYFCAPPVPGSARVSRVGDGVLAIADFLFPLEIRIRWRNSRKVRFGATPKPARETRALPIIRASYGLGGGVGRGLGVARDLGVGVGLGVAVGLAVAVAVGVGLCVAVGATVGVAVEVTVAVAVGVALAVEVAV